MWTYWNFARPVADEIGRISGRPRWASSCWTTRSGSYEAFPQPKAHLLAAISILHTAGSVQTHRYKTSWVPPYVTYCLSRWGISRIQKKGKVKNDTEQTTKGVNCGKAKRIERQNLGHQLSTRMHVKPPPWFSRSKSRYCIPASLWHKTTEKRLLLEA